MVAQKTGQERKRKEIESNEERGLKEGDKRVSTWSKWQHYIEMRNDGNGSS